MADVTDKPNTRTLVNGAKQDVTTGRIVAGAVLSRDTARDMVRARVEKKRRAVAEAANEAVQRDDLRLKYGDTAYIAEIAQAQMQIATTPDAGKAAVMAASWLVEHSGMGEKQAEQDAARQAQVPIPAAVLLLVAEAVDYVDAEVIPSSGGGGGVGGEG